MNHVTLLKQSPSKAQGSELASISDRIAALTKLSPKNVAKETAASLLLLRRLADLQNCRTAHLGAVFLHSRF